MSESARHKIFKTKDEERAFLAFWENQRKKKKEKELLEYANKVPKTHYHFVQVRKLVDSIEL